MTPEERLIQSIFFKERWTLIQKEIDHRAIKICGNMIFVNNKLHGEVKNSSLYLRSIKFSQLNLPLKGPNGIVGINNNSLPAPLPPPTSNTFPQECPVVLASTPH